MPAPLIPVRVRGQKALYVGRHELSVKQLTLALRDLAVFVTRLTPGGLQESAVFK
jgi:hypothetical protein